MIAVSTVVYYWTQIPVSHIQINHTPPVTILIPVRNEETGIKRTLNSILSNDYEFLEVIVIDDHSTDDTIQMVKSISNSDKIKLIRLDKEQSGKKAAITKGVTTAKSQLIICTDGDTVVSSNWIQEHVAAFQLGSKLSFGPVVYESNSIWVNVLNLELTALVGVGGASVQAGQASMINGCNYSFSKRAFEKVKGFEGNDNIPTGDDEFLLRKIKNDYPDNITFLKSKTASVATESVTSLRELINQRIRWASKWKYHSEVGSKLLPIYLFVLYLSILIIPWFLSNDYQYFFLIALGVKTLIDYILISVVSRITGAKVSFLAFMALEIIYPIYVVFFGLASNFGNYKWQGRSYHV